MSTLAIIGAVAMIVISILIIVVVSLQEGKGDGITALAGVSAFLNDSNDRSANAKLSKLTKILAIIFHPAGLHPAVTVDHPPKKDAVCGCRRRLDFYGEEGPAEKCRPSPKFLK